MDNDWRAAWNNRTPRLGARVRRIVFGDLILLSLVGASLEVVLWCAGYEKDSTANVATEEHGYREPAFSGEKPPGQCRLLAYGDSTTFGTDVCWRDTFAKQLQDRLNAGLDDDRFLVVNAGRPGDDLHRLSTRVDRDCELVKPDTVLLTMSPYMVAQQYIARTAPAKDEGGAPSRPKASRRSVKSALLSAHFWLYQHSGTYHFLLSEPRLMFYQVGLLQEELTPKPESPIGIYFAYAFDGGAESQRQRIAVEDAYADLGRSLDAIQDALRRRHVELVVAAIPSQFTISDLRSDNVHRVDKARISIDPYERFREMADTRGLPFVDLMTGLRESRVAMIDGNRTWDPLYLRGDTTHLNPTGHRVVAEVIENFLRRDTSVARFTRSFRW